MKTSVNSVHNAPRLLLTGPDVQADRARRGGWGRERSVIDKPGPIFRPLLHRPLLSPTPQNLRHRHRDLLSQTQTHKEQAVTGRIFQALPT